MRFLEVYFCYFLQLNTQFILSFSPFWVGRSFYFVVAILITSSVLTDFTAHTLASCPTAVSRALLVLWIRFVISVVVLFVTSFAELVVKLRYWFLTSWFSQK